RRRDGRVAPPRHGVGADHFVATRPGLAGRAGATSSGMVGPQPPRCDRQRAEGAQTAVTNKWVGSCDGEVGRDRPEVTGDGSRGFDPNSVSFGLNEGAALANKAAGVYLVLALTTTPL